MQLSAILEAHETLPASLTPYPSSLPKKLRRQHAEFHASLTPNTLRAAFALDIPSDAAPAFLCQCLASSSSSPSSPSPTSKPGSASTAPGGLTWKVRLCLLVSVASPHARAGFEGIRTKHLLRDGPRGAWAAAWRPTRGIEPLQNIDLRKEAQSRAAGAGRGAVGDGEPDGQGERKGWAAYFLSGLLTPGEREYHDGDEDDEDEGEEEEGRRGVEYDEGLVIDEETGEVDVGGGDAGWSELRVETVECEVPIAVWPGNTAFRPLEVVFDV